MANKSKIEWTEVTWNPLRGTKGKWFCTKVSEGCANCYAERMNHRFGGPPYVHGEDKIRLDADTLIEPLNWRKPRRVFVCSMTDLFHEDVSDDMIRTIFAVMASCPDSTFMVLTKRAERMQKLLSDFHWRIALITWKGEKRKGATYKFPVSFDENVTDRPMGAPPNVWIGVSAENQERYDERLPHLIQTPAGTRFLSCEPLLGPIELSLIGTIPKDWGLGYKLVGDFIDWVIVGGESGPRARRMNPNWVRGIRDQCVEDRIPFFFKQWGEWAHTDHLTEDTYGELDKAINLSGLSTQWFKVGKKKAGRELDGKIWEQYPELEAVAC